MKQYFLTILKFVRGRRHVKTFLLHKTNERTTTVPLITAACLSFLTVDRSRATIMNVFMDYLKWELSRNTYTYPGSNAMVTWHWWWYATLFQRCSHPNKHLHNQMV